MLKEKLGSAFSALQTAPPPLVGVDISSSALKLVELAEAGKGSYRLERYAIEPLTKDEEHFIQDMVLARGKDWIMLNKPPGLATQGGTKTVQHLDRLLDALADEKGQRPKLVHRLDKDTSGVLLVARPGASLSAASDRRCARSGSCCCPEASALRAD